MISNELYAEIAVRYAVDRLFVYLVPPRLRGEELPGRRALVPFGKKILTGYVIDTTHETSVSNPKSLIDLLDERPILSRPLLDLARWMAAYYSAPLGRVIRTMLPAGMEVQSRAMVHLANDIEENGLTDDTKRIIDSFFAHGPVPLHRLRAGIGAARFKKFFNQGMLATTQELSPPKVKKKSIVYLKLTHPYPDQENLAALGKKAPKQAQVLRKLAKMGGEGPQSMLGSSPAVNALVKKGFIVKEKRRSLRIPFSIPGEHEADPQTLTPIQEKIVGAVSEKIEAGEYRSFLLHGVTGSGKTEVYIRAVQQAVRAEGQAIVLAPEISLTPQLVSRFARRFGDRVAVFHSALSAGERLDEFHRMRTGEVDVVIGARSAIFAPFADLRLIVVDEEHETSYKQESVPCYHARDVAIMRAVQEKVPIILGSATPSLESFFNTRLNKSTLVEMPERVENRPMPAVAVVDMCEADIRGEEAIFSEILAQKIEQRMVKNEQALLFLNRRGFASFLLCRSCGHAVRCPHCDVTLTYHRAAGMLICHYCDFSMKVIKRCPECRKEPLGPMGWGTQKIEAELKNFFPEARITRVDRDTTGAKNAHWEIYRKLTSGSVDIVVGTQMIAKGLHLPKVTLVGVLCADMALYLPDFRAAERTFCLLTQVAGRSGRGENPGAVVIQSFNPSHYSIQAAMKHDYNKFVERELRYRRLLNYPPFTRVVNIMVKHRDPGQGYAQAKKLALVLAKSNHAGIRTSGPNAAPLAKIRGLYRWQIIVKGDTPSTIRKFLQNPATQKELSHNSVSVDVDPIHLL
jgi:primosomal protein N' (replication factor Y)